MYAYTHATLKLSYLYFFLFSQLLPKIISFRKNKNKTQTHTQQWVWRLVFGQQIFEQKIQRNDINPSNVLKGIKDNFQQTNGSFCDFIYLCSMWHGDAWHGNTIASCCSIAHITIGQCKPSFISFQSELQQDPTSSSLEDRLQAISRVTEREVDAPDHEQPL